MPAILSAENGAAGAVDREDGEHFGGDLDSEMTQRKRLSNSSILQQQRCLPSLHESSFRLSHRYAKSIRVTFYVNGDRHFRGLNYVINLDRIKTLDLLCAELSRLLVSVKTLPSGVRFILDGADGTPVESVQQLAVNGHYVCSSTVRFVRLNYGQTRPDHTDSTAASNGSTRHLARLGNGISTSGRIFNLLSTSAHTPHRAKHHASSNGSSLTLSASLSLYSSGATAVRPKIVALLRGSCRAAPSQRPSRRAFRFLLNYRIAQTYEQLLNEISSCVQLNIGAVHRVYGLSSNKKITSLDDFFDNEYVYLVYGRTEKCSLVDFMLDECEQLEIASIVRPSYQFPDLVKIKPGRRDVASKTTIRFQLTPKERRTRQQQHQPSARTPKRARDGNNNDKDLKAFSLPRNFLANSQRNPNYQQLSSHFYAAIGDEHGHGQSHHRSSGDQPLAELDRTMPKMKGAKYGDNYDSSAFSSIYSLKEEASDRPTRGYDLKNSNSDNLLSDLNPFYRSPIYSTISNSLVLDPSNRHHCPSDDTGSNGNHPPSFSGSSTPGAASSVSCSEDFSYASVEPAGAHVDAIDGLTDPVTRRPVPSYSSSSSDSSTPSFSSLSCVVRYPGSLPPAGSKTATTHSGHSSQASTAHSTASANSTPRHQAFRPNREHLYADTSSEVDDPLELDGHAHHSPELLKPEREPFEPKKEVAKLYRVGEAIGDGKFGVVYTCIHRSTGRVYALKVVDKGAMQEMMAESKEPPSKNSAANSEAAILKRICHQNIVRIYDHFEYVDQSYLVLELFKGGDLFDAISTATKYTESEAVEMVNDLMQALAYLHRRNIIHRDIKLENLMVAFVPLSTVNRTNEDGSIPRRYRQMIKLADFGLAVEINPNELLFTVCGTPTYVAPEILLEIGYSFPVDIWAAGVIAYILLCGFPPFANEENDQDTLFDQIISGKFDFEGRQWAEVSDAAKDLITSMLTVEQAERATAAQVLCHQWLQSGEDWH